MAALLFKCPKTNQQAPPGIGTDTQSLRQLWQKNGQSELPPLWRNAQNLDTQYVRQVGKAKAQASMQPAPNPIAVCPHSSRPQSRMSSRTAERAVAAGIAHNQMFTGTTTKYE
jgi:hypothetical protein